MSAASPFWVSNAGKGNATLYNGAGTITNIVVTIPPGSRGPARSSPTGQVNNGSTVFLLPSGVRASFIFATEDGTISAWQSGAAATLMVDNSPTGAVYEGLTSGTSSVGPVLYAPNFNSGNIDVFNGTWAPVTLVGAFKDPTLPAGFAPFNIQNLKGSLYVMYAKQNDLKKRDVAGPGNGFVSVFDLNGNFLKRLISNDVLNSPWGAAIAPATWEAFGGNLLIGNFGNGRINAFDLSTGAFKGTLQDKAGQPIVNSGLWGLTFGNGGNGGDPNTLYFSAGIQNETHGLFGALAPPSAIITVVNAASGATGPVAPGEIVLLGGFTIGPSPRVAPALPATGTVVTTAGGVTVEWDGRPSPILYASASTVATIVPYELGAAASANVNLKFANAFNTQTTPTFSTPLAVAAPGLFTLDASGTGQVLAINQDGTVNNATNAAARNSAVLFYATGEGALIPSPANGTITVGRVVPGPVLSVSATVGGIDARVILATAAPGSVAGVLQVEVIVPNGVTVGPAAVVLQVGNNKSPLGTTLNVK